MLGAIIGDMAGSTYEFDNIRTKDFPFLGSGCFPTDDSFMTAAVACAIMRAEGDEEMLPALATEEMRRFFRAHPDAGYGGRFYRWASSKDPKPCGSFGNGSAMRVSPCGLAAATLEEAKTFSRAVTLVSHDHAEGLKGAEAVAVAVFLAGAGSGMDEIREAIERDYYRIDFTLDEIRDDYEFDETCQGSVPQALEAFFESASYEDAVRNAVSIGGDSDTIAAIAGSIAEPFYGIPESLRRMAFGLMTDDLADAVRRFEKLYPPRVMAG